VEDVYINCSNKEPEEINPKDQVLMKLRRRFYVVNNHYNINNNIYNNSIEINDWFLKISFLFFGMIYSSISLFLFNFETIQFFSEEEIRRCRDVLLFGFLLHFSIKN
jgi:hypothetical protein